MQGIGNRLPRNLLEPRLRNPAPSGGQGPDSRWALPAATREQADAAPLHRSAQLEATRRARRQTIERHGPTPNRVRLNATIGDRSLSYSRPRPPESQPGVSAALIKEPM
jgi:hypothetical protein